jgi:hypothetical protein
MNRRGRRLIAAIAGLVALLFVGRWVAGLLADRWWAAQISPAAVEFLTDWHVLRLTLDLAGFLLASAWFIGHLLVVYRAVGSVQVRRNVANLEFREALTPGILLAIAVGSGALLGLLVGTGGAERWRSCPPGGWHTDLPSCWWCSPSASSSVCTSWSAPCAGSRAGPLSTIMRARTSAGC